MINTDRYAEYVEQVIEPGEGGQSDRTDPVDDLDRLAVIEAELSAAEAELDQMDNPSVDQDPGADL